MIGLEAVSAASGGVTILHEVSVEVPEGQTLAVLGPSGSGKSTLLRVVAGLLAPAGGRVVIRGQDVTETPPHRRGVGLVFQDAVLFPHLDVGGNIAFGLPRAQRQDGHRVSTMLELVGLPGFERRRVATLSGGEAQRVALARALAPGPSVLLLDEPLSALDGPLRQRLQDDLAGILRSTDVTVVHVTHDVGEAFALGDRVAVLRAGRLVQAATPEELWRHPGSAWIANFIGRGNVVTAADGTQSSIAPEAITLQAGDEAMVTSVERRGPVLVVTVRRDDGVTLVASIGGLRRVRVGDRVSVAIEPDGVAALGRV